VFREREGRDEQSLKLKGAVGGRREEGGASARKNRRDEGERGRKDELRRTEEVAMLVRV